MRWFRKSHLPFHSSLMASKEEKWRHSLYSVPTLVNSKRGSLWIFSKWHILCLWNYILLWPMRKDTGAWSIFWSSDRYCILALVCSSKFLRMMLETPSLRDFSAHGLESHYEYFFLFYTWRYSLILQTHMEGSMCVYV